jgi:LPXTG-site transpeptidase (sortase) family protein
MGGGPPGGIRRAIGWVAVVVLPAVAAGAAVILLAAPEGAPSGALRPVVADLPAPAPRLARAPARHGRQPPPSLVRVRSRSIDVPVVPIDAEDGHLVVPPVDRVGWVRGGPRPGEPGRTVLIGHRDSATGAAPFAALASLRPGARVVTVGGGSRHRYRVTAIQQTAKTKFPAARVYSSTRGSTLALITCDGVFDERTDSYVDNLIVYAREVARTPRARARRA